MKVIREDVLAYHGGERPGKIEVTPTKPLATQADLALAYTPGVAEVCKEIAKDHLKAYDFTSKGNLVGLLSNGTSLLGLGNQGPVPAKPVMEGKAVLFKRFADIDVFDIELDTEEPEEIVYIAQRIAPTFGAICLEDIKSPECFAVEKALIEKLSIPVFHDDQHGTAIVVSAALLNALEIADKRLPDVRIVFCGAGAAAHAIVQMLAQLGARRENIIVCDSKGVIYKGREENMKPHKFELASETQLRTIADALKGADVFIGVSTAHCVSKGMAQSMVENPIIFALANPEPEITYEEAQQARGEPIIATGRSDYPNQVNNVLAFPAVFRGALDTRATAINDAMKLAAVRALSDLAREDVPDAVLAAYKLESLSFGRTYIIPKPLDPRVVLRVAPAVAKAAMETGVARQKIDLDAYVESLQKKMNRQEK
ncbi:MAG: NAD-dependent malic enzyme [Candidatus Peribacteraceae bacterium]|nr:NAD-dependent malic enzyme [Candidatus Peribacteraceae bacterium]